MKTLVKFPYRLMFQHANVLNMALVLIYVYIQNFD